MMTVATVSMRGPAHLRTVLERAITLLWADQSTLMISHDPRELVLTSWDGIESHLRNRDLSIAVARFKEEGCQRLFAAHAARLGDWASSVIIDAVAIPAWYGTEPAPTSYPSVLRVLVDANQCSVADRDRLFDWGHKYLSEVAKIHDAVSGRVTVGVGPRTHWERKRRGPVRAPDMYYWVAESRVLSPDWCLLLSQEQVEQIGGLDVLKDLAYSVDETRTQSSTMFVIRVTERLSDLADSPHRQRDWIRILQPILW